MRPGGVAQLQTSTDRRSASPAEPHPTPICLRTLCGPSPSRPHSIRERSHTRQCLAPTLPCPGRPPVRSSTSRHDTRRQHYLVLGRPARRPQVCVRTVELDDAREHHLRRVSSWYEVRYNLTQNHPHNLLVSAAKLCRRVVSELQWLTSLRTGSHGSQALGALASTTGSPSPTPRKSRPPNCRCASSVERAALMSGPQRRGCARTGLAPHVYAHVTAYRTVIQAAHCPGPPLEPSPFLRLFTCSGRTHVSSQ